ncbi:GntR family transcriptional regulator [Crossiella sp. SN42]|uniref:GntR family transcriptional regulator n=1 Tax=Crossiella sp. SN42 TaxID=2944808 RepID=UPI00207CBCB9|nr:GntR family transcriptional regulator [Crossiella sp. SN42]MCO1579153.1 GntR family transcriptional regulator [Crossiella sp. SN42]
MSEMPPLDPADTRPSYQQAADIIRDRIISGVYKVGDHLPSFVELGKRFGVNSSTVQKGVRMLQEQGFVASAPGRGTWVLSATPAPVDPVLQRLDEIDDRIASLETVVEELLRREGHTPR